jgi:hypothetical protein
MGCNAWNHSRDCTCDFRGGHGFGGGGRYGGGARATFSAVPAEPASAGWSRAQGDGTVASHVNPNARCPVCGASVYFYRSPYDGRVFFDDLGPPWPKHGCTDSGRWPDGSRRQGAPLYFRSGDVFLEIKVSDDNSDTDKPTVREEGWEPLCSSRVSETRWLTVLTGELGGRPAELFLFDLAKFDHDGPVFVRAHERAPGLHVIALLQSDSSGTRERYHFAFDERLTPVRAELLSRAVKDQDAVALSEVGRFFFHCRADLPAAIKFLEWAYAEGATDVAMHLAVAALLCEGDCWTEAAIRRS